ncbi:ion channel [uncultured Sulfitobacter sp.]|uniref:ion channel n=1 Tax=uncultured Sulfitobacter sp. TaxID=191468 RepID=UPI00261E841B|nr:ion channel [uncultured Sulfitobacter sp.]
MGAIQQILLGTAFLTFGAVFHVGAIAWSIPYFSTLAQFLDMARHPRLRSALLLTFAVFVLVSAHTVQVWTWSVAFLWITDLPDLAASFYFATVTYTTLGYGDIVLDADSRIVATFCAINGLLTFGISTALLVGVVGRILPDVSAGSPKG